MSNSLLEQFILETRECLERCGTIIIKLEEDKSSESHVNEIFRLVHTLKGNSGLFTFTGMTKLLHVSEDLLNLVREGEVEYSSSIADTLLEVMDVISIMVDEIESSGSPSKESDLKAGKITEKMKNIIPSIKEEESKPSHREKNGEKIDLSFLPHDVLEKVRELLLAGKPVSIVRYIPEEECFFKGEDPFYFVRNIPGLFWGRCYLREKVEDLELFDVFRCITNFEACAVCDEERIRAYFQYVQDQVSIWKITVNDITEKANCHEILEIPDEMKTIFEEQKRLLDNLPSDDENLRRNILFSVLTTLENSLFSTGNKMLLQRLKSLTNECMKGNAEGVAAFIDEILSQQKRMEAKAEGIKENLEDQDTSSKDVRVNKNRVLKVDETKIDRLMNLVGELVVAKNSLLHLSRRISEMDYATSGLSREIKNCYSVVNRITQEMHDAVMQIRMVPVSSVFQRFPRLIRDLSRKLEKKVSLIMEGEETEADKNIVESIADPLIHILRNSMDHGIETPDERLSNGKKETGVILIKARNEGENLVITVEDDGKGIDPKTLKKKAYEKGLLTEEQLEAISDEEAINLIFLPGFSTAKESTEFSGRGVGMDAVKSYVERFNGSVKVSSVKGKGTIVTLRLPITMAVSQVLIIETAERKYGIPMDLVAETVKIKKKEIHTFKGFMNASFRGRVIPIFFLNHLLGIDRENISNEDGEYATCIIGRNGKRFGIIVDRLIGATDVIIRPFSGFLANLRIFSGSAIMGDGSIILVVNPKELISWQ